MLLHGVIIPFDTIQHLKAHLCFSGSQLSPWRADFDTRCYEGNQDVDSHCHADRGHICTITIQVQRGVWVRT